MEGGIGEKEKKEQQGQEWEAQHKKEDQLQQEEQQQLKICEKKEKEKQQWQDQLDQQDQGQEHDQQQNHYIILHNRILKSNSSVFPRSEGYISQYTPYGVYGLIVNENNEVNISLTNVKII